MAIGAQEVSIDSQLALKPIVIVLANIGNGDGANTDFYWVCRTGSTTGRLRVRALDFVPNTTVALAAGDYYTVTPSVDFDSNAAEASTQTGGGNAAAMAAGARWAPITVNQNRHVSEGTIVRFRINATNPGGTLPIVGASLTITVEPERDPADSHYMGR